MQSNGLEIIITTSIDLGKNYEEAPKSRVCQAKFRMPCVNLLKCIQNLLDEFIYITQKYTFLHVRPIYHKFTERTINNMLVPFSPYNKYLLKIVSREIER